MTHRLIVRPIWCHDCRRYTLPEAQSDTDAPTCGQCGSEYQCDECGGPLESSGYCPA